MSESLKEILTEKKIKSTMNKGRFAAPPTAESIEQLAKEKMASPALAILWLNHTVLGGHYTPQAADIWSWSAEMAADDWRQLVELRIFNDEGELLITPTYWRLRTDIAEGGAGEDTFVVDAAARLWGECATPAALRERSFARLIDKGRKISLTVPLPVGMMPSDGLYYELATRNYIGYAETGQAGYIDYRLLAIKAGRD